MGKVLYFLVFMAVIAQIYTVPAPLPAPDQDDAPAKGVEDQVKQGEGKAMKTAGSAGGFPEAAEGMFGPILTFGKSELSDGEKVVNDLIGVPLLGVPAKN